MAADRQDARKSMMLEQPISKVIPKMAIPTIVAFLINSVYSLADTFFVSSLGTNATAAVSVNSSLDQIIMMAGSMLAIGANSYIARLLGAKREEEANKVLSVAFFIALAFGTILAMFGCMFMTPMVRMLGATDTCLQYSIDYATYVLLVAPFMASSFVMNQCLRAEGSAVLSMIGMGFGSILNCVLDPIFIFTLDLGVAGASMATAISKLVSFSILIFPYITKRSVLRLSIRFFQPNREILSQIVKIGSSSMFRSGLAVVAGIGVTNKIMMFPFSVILGFGSGFQPVTGFNWGAKRFDRVLESYRFSAKCALIISVSMAVLLGLFANQVILLFAEADAEMQAIGALSIRLQCLALPIHAWVAVVNMFCNGLGKAKGALLLATARQGSCFLSIVYPMAWLFDANGVAAVQAVADVLTLALAIPLIRKVLKEVKGKAAEAGQL